MTDLELTEKVARWCGIYWHDYKIGDSTQLSTCKCGRKGVYVRDMCAKENYSFAPLHDWNDLMTKVVPKLPSQLLIIDGNHFQLQSQDNTLPKIQGSYSDLPRAVCELIAEMEEE